MRPHASGIGVVDAYPRPPPMYVPNSKGPDMKIGRSDKVRHSRASGNPGPWGSVDRPWTAAFAGATNDVDKQPVQFCGDSLISGTSPRDPRAKPGEGEEDNAVRAFYESHPYPAPLRDLDRHRELYRNPVRRRALSLLLWPTEKPQPDREILVAGCGTSQAAAYALREPEARVTAIDISETSLSHTRELQEKYGLRNLELHRLAIEEVGELGQSFDQIVCTGVLHHLPDPDVGLKSLRNVLAPEGAMHVMVYATYGRAGIYMMQEYCRRLGIGTTEAELRALGAVIDALSVEHPIAGVANRTKDFNYPDALADTLVHPQDRAFTVPQLHAWLERCGLEFARWIEQAPYLPQCGAIARMPHAALLAALSPREQHAAIELLRGTMTKHNFIAYRDRSE